MCVKVIASQRWDVFWDKVNDVKLLMCVVFLYICVYTVSGKQFQYTFVPNFGRCWPISTLVAAHLAVN